jgi:hypothetical protein
MGGPSRESWLRSEEARKRRIAALRTRDGVVDLAELRAAQKAAEFLRTTLGQFSLVLGVRVVVAAEVGFELVVTLARDDRRVRVCLPSAVNDIPVRIEVRNPGRSPASVSAPCVSSDPS